MKSYIKKSFYAILALTFLNACSDNNNEVEIPLSEIPPNIINIIQNTLPGFSLTEAEKQIKKDTVIYELEGKLIDGKEYEIEITKSGTIIKIELED